MPRWVEGGHEIIYEGLNRQVMSVAINPGTNRLVAGEPHALFTLPEASASTSYDVTADGQRFLVPVPPDHRGRPLHVILNWPLG